MNKKVLIAEDDAETAKALRSAVNSWGYEAVIVRNGLDAHDMLIKNPGAFQAVVSDVRMPGGSGLMLCQALDRADDGTVPPMLLHSSERDHYEQGVHIDDLGALVQIFDFLKSFHVKPVTQDYRYVREFLASQAGGG